MADRKLGLALDRASQQLTQRIRKQGIGWCCRFRFVYDPDPDVGAYSIFLTLRTTEQEIGRAVMQGERPHFEPKMGELGTDHAFYCGAFAALFYEVADRIAEAS